MHSNYCGLKGLILVTLQMVILTVLSCVELSPPIRYSALEQRPCVGTLSRQGVCKNLPLIHLLGKKSLLYNLSASATSFYSVTASFNVTEFVKLNKFCDFRLPPRY
jgi:hypothetical protein